MTYPEYMKSEHWRLLRGAKLQLNPRCEKCKSKDELEVHHKQYEADLCKCTVKDLVTLCRNHHLQEHYGQWKKPDEPKFYDYTKKRGPGYRDYVDPNAVGRQKRLKKLYGL